MPDEIPELTGVQTEPECLFVEHNAHLGNETWKVFHLDCSRWVCRTMHIHTQTKDIKFRTVHYRSVETEVTLTALEMQFALEKIREVLDPENAQELPASA